MNRVRIALAKYLLNNDNKEILQHSSLLFFAKVFFALVSFFLSIIIARNLSIDDSGYYFLIISLVAVLSTISRIGLDNTVTRFIARANAKSDEKKVSLVSSIAFRWTMLSSLLLSLLVAMFGLVYVYFAQPPKNHQVLLMVVVLLLPITSVFQILQQSFQGLKKTTLFALF